MAGGSLCSCMAAAQWNVPPQNQFIVSSQKYYLLNNFPRQQQHNFNWHNLCHKICNVRDFYLIKFQEKNLNLNRNSNSDLQISMYKGTNCKVCFHKFINLCVWNKCSVSTWPAAWLVSTNHKITGSVSILEISVSGLYWAWNWVHLTSGGQFEYREVAVLVKNVDTIKPFWFL